MKRSPNFNLLLLFMLGLSLTLGSCSNEDLLSEVIAQNDNQEPDSNSPAPPASTNALDINKTPCNYTLVSLNANETLNVACQLDLEGKNITLPANVTLEYDGGEIINGTLTFDGGKIDGDLLNQNIEVTGNVTLIDPKFSLHPERWDIIEGEVSQDEAANNAVVVNELMNIVQRLGANAFVIGKLDAYFYDDRPWRGGIEIPSNMNFEMSSSTYLRPLVTAGFRGLIYLKDVENVKVSGGTLHGPRNITGYDPYVGGGGNLIAISSGVNILIENVRLIESSQDGMNCFSTKFSTDPEYIPSQNVTIKNCVFDSSRRNNLSITDGIDYLVDGCTFLRAGIDMTHSSGLAPRYGIDLEPHMPNQKLERVIIRNSTESGSAAGGMVFAAGKDYLFENNTFEGRIANTVSENVRIINNTLGSIIIGLDNAIGSSKNTVISGNTLIGPADGTKTGIQLYNQDVKAYDNVIKNFGVGIQLIGLKDAHIYNNSIESEGPSGDGINALFYVDNVLVENNTIKVNDKPYFFAHINKQEEHAGYSFTFKNNSFESNMYGFMSNTTGLNFIGNILTSGMNLGGSINALLDGNTFKTSKPFCIALGGDRTNNIRIVNNLIENDDTEGQGNGITGESSSGEDKNIEISNNTFSVKGYNRGLQLKGFHGITVKNNSGNTELRPLIEYSGNNSTFTNNINQAVNPVPNDISGNNNTVN